MSFELVHSSAHPLPVPMGTGVVPLGITIRITYIPQPHPYLNRQSMNFSEHLFVSACRFKRQTSIVKRLKSFFFSSVLAVLYILFFKVDLDVVALQEPYGGKDV